MRDIRPDAFSLRSIQYLDDAIGKCHDTTERLVLKAKKAVSLVSHSYTFEANEIIQELRVLNHAYDPRLTGWINYAEGIFEHFETLDNKKAKSKLNRGLLFSQMAMDRELAGACSAWVAHCDFVDGRIDAAASNIVKAFEWSEPDEHEARARASMLLADAFNAVDQVSTSRYWFRVARNHASSAGDMAMQNVMLFNIAAYSVARLTLDDCRSGADPSSIRRASMEVASASNLNSALGIQALPTLVPTMRAELFIVEKRWSEAISILTDRTLEIASKSPARLIPKVIAQRAWCRANLGDLKAAEADLHTSLAACADCSDDDDRAVLHFRLSGVSRIVDRPDLESKNLETANEYFLRFTEHQASIRAMLESVLEKIACRLKNPA